MSFVYTQPYIVVGAFIVRDGKILLVKENHLPDKGKWNIPAGKLDYGEDPASAAAREAFEESGLAFTPTAILGLHSVLRHDVPGSNPDTHVIRIVYLGEVNGDTTTANSGIVDGQLEIAECMWVTPEELLQMDISLIRYHDLKDYVRDYLQGVAYPLQLIPHTVQNKISNSN
ncbi:MAG: nudJ [Candidatus Saccharibacteria bacterium]|nr:nudJ [Candidatus Saccharibacteria bacterium]